MNPTRLRRWMRQYGAFGVLMVACCLGWRALWVRRKRACIIAVLLLSSGAPITYAAFRWLAPHTIEERTIQTLTAEEATTKLYEAVQYDDLNLAGLLLDHRADINAANGPEDDSEIQDLTPLLTAITRQHFDMAKFLLQRGAKVECYDRARKTPLLWAAYYGQIELLQLLLLHGANLKAEDGMDQTALMLARKGNHPNVVACLQSQGLTEKPEAAVRMNALHHVIVTLPLALQPGSNIQRLVTYEATPFGTALNIRQNGKLIAKPVTFEDLLTNAALWTQDERNAIRYQMGRSYYSANAYRFFGLVTLQDRTYLGVLWYSPAASAEDQIAHFVFELRVVGNALELEVVEKSDMEDHGLSRTMDLPRLEKSPEDDLIRLDWDGKYQYMPNGSWSKIGPRPPDIASIDRRN